MAGTNNGLRNAPPARFTHASIAHARLTLPSDTLIAAAEAHSDALRGLVPLAERLGRHDVVLLGENGAGAEFGRLKARLIELLHQSYGFDVLVFTTGMIDCHVASEQIERTGARSALRAVRRLLRTPDVLRLFEYVHSTRSLDEQGPGSLDMIGIDPRPTRRQSWFLVRTVAETDCHAASALANIEPRMTYLTRNGSVFGRADRRLFNTIRPLALAIYHGALKALERASALGWTHTRRICRRTIESRLALLDVACSPTAYFDYRQQWMAENLAWIREELYPGRRIVMWSHNYHVRKCQSEVDGDSTMGEYLPAELDAFSVGLYMRQGHVMWHTYKEREIPAVPIDTMEAKLAAPGVVSFVDLRAIGQARGAIGPKRHWLERACRVMSQGVHPETIIPAEQYGGIVVVDEVTPPTLIDTYIL